MIITWHIFEILGTIAFAFSGVMVGISKKMDIFGIAVLAIVTAIGGGIMRDVMVGMIPPLSLRTPDNLMISLITVTMAIIGMKIFYLPTAEKKSVESLISIIRRYRISLVYRHRRYDGHWSVSGIFHTAADYACSFDSYRRWDYSRRFSTADAGGFLYGNICGSIACRCGFYLCSKNVYRNCLRLMGGIFHCSDPPIIGYCLSMEFISSCEIKIISEQYVF